MREFGLLANVIEKDYVLGWVLAGIFNHPEIGKSWAFKGGTCLKKCYFETYRFSEDLDFTLTDPGHLDRDFLAGCFEEIAEWVHDTTGIEVPGDLIRFEVYENNRGGMAAEGRIGYQGPMRPGGTLPRIKLDLTTDELLVEDPVIKNVHHPYSDCPAGGIQINCYCFEEVFAEKIRALAERERPRDLYDVVHLYRHDELAPDQAVILSTLEKKCAFKQIAVPTMKTFTNRPERDELEAEWANMLKHQLPVLPSFEQFWAELPQVMEWLHGAAQKVKKGSIPSGRMAIDHSWQPPAMAQAWHTAVPLEKIRFAAANRLCVNLFYDGKYRLIEPYSLRRSQAGDLLLFAIRHHTNEPRSYRVDHIQGAEITDTPFVPKYTVELTPSGPVAAPPLARSSGNIPSLRTTTALKTGRQTLSVSRSSSSGPTYVIECPYCGKKFNRKSPGTRLNPHKDKSGYPCPGRTGYHVDTKY
ncbi:MAG: nucleotidyl transferase AbiEii/AbiGii toxin family protein [Thermodesulfobacteriota bacterium]